MRTKVSLRRTGNVVELRFLAVVEDDDRPDPEEVEAADAPAGGVAELAAGPAPGWPSAEAVAADAERVDVACEQMLETLSRELHERGRVFEVARQGGDLGEALRILSWPKLSAGGQP